MKKEWQDIISQQLWVEPIEINSSLVSAQSRRRLYWTNIPNVTQPQDKGILLKDILQENVDEKYNFSKERWEKILNTNYDIWKRLENIDGKCNTLVTNGWGNHEKKIMVSYAPWSREFFSNWWREDKVPSNTLTTQWELYVCEKVIRKLTPIECERLQTLPDDYTAWVSDSQRYKMLGNWWTVDVISHIFSFMECISPIKDAVI